jgi:hypothetical protein
MAAARLRRRAATSPRQSRKEDGLRRFNLRGCTPSSRSRWPCTVLVGRVRLRRRGPRGGARACGACGALSAYEGSARAHPGRRVPPDEVAPVSSAGSGGSSEAGSQGGPPRGGAASECGSDVFRRRGGPARLRVCPTETLRHIAAQEGASVPTVVRAPCQRPSGLRAVARVVSVPTCRAASVLTIVRPPRIRSCGLRRYDSTASLPTTVYPPRSHRGERMRAMHPPQIHTRVRRPRHVLYHRSATFSSWGEGACNAPTPNPKAPP